MAAKGLPVQLACRLLSVAESGYYVAITAAVPARFGMPG